jgi:hypothetical protein
MGWSNAVNRRSKKMIQVRRKFPLFSVNFGSSNIGVRMGTYGTVCDSTRSVLGFSLVVSWLRETAGAS